MRRQRQKNNDLRKIEPRDIMRYYVAYFDIEKSIIDAVNSSNKNERIKALDRYLNKYMKIGRNFKSKSAERLLNIIDNLNRDISVVELSETLGKEKELLSGKTKNVLVAASKLRWLFDHKTIIMDNNNRKLLGAVVYKDYEKEWKMEFSKKIDEINEVIETSFSNVDCILKEDWFKMRVFDMYLLSVYGENEAKRNKSLHIE